MWKMGFRILVGLCLIQVLHGDPTPRPQLDLPPISHSVTSSSTPATNPLINTTPVTPSPITISEKNGDLVLPNSYAGENFSEEEQHPIGDFESDRSNRYGPPYDDEAEFYNSRNPWVGISFNTL